MDGLCDAVCDGSVERTIALLSQGPIDIDGVDREGLTPLICAAIHDHAPVARILINRGAGVSTPSTMGLTALLASAHHGHAGVAEVLIKAGADVELTDTTGGPTPMIVAAIGGHWQVMRALAKAGANVNSGCAEWEHRPPLLMAAEGGHVNAVRELLRAKANPLLDWTDQETGASWLPLDVAALNGHSEVVNEMVRQVGIESCGGVSGGVHALVAAVERNNLDIVAILTDAGVVDTGLALAQAARYGNEASVKILLKQHQQQQQKQKGGRSTGRDAYVNTHSRGATPLLRIILYCRPCSPKMVRLLVDAGADTTSAVPMTRGSGSEVQMIRTPLSLTNFFLVSKTAGGRDATEQQLNALKAIRRLLLQVEAVHAVSWLWHSRAPVVGHAAAERARRTTTPSTPLTLMMPILRRRAARRGVLFAALYRQSSKP